MREPLGKHISIKHGYAFDGEFFVEEDNGVVLLTPGNFAIGGGFQEGKKYYDGPYPDEYVLSSGDLVVTMTDLSKTIDTLGYAALIPDDGRVYLHNQRIGLIEFKDNELDKVYLSYLLRTYHYQRTIAGSSAGSTVHHTSPAKIEAYPVNLPSVSAQKRIADILSVYDKLIENNRKQIALLEEAAQRLYKEWFVDLRFPGYETTPIIDGLPEGWRKGVIGEIADYISRGVTPKYSEESNWRVLGQTCVRDNLVLLENSRRLDPIMTPDKALRRGDLLINSTGVGSLGRTAQVWFDPDRLTADSHITIVRDSTGIYSNYMAQWAFGNERFIESLQTGSTGQTELPKDRVRSIPITIPNVENVEQFNEVSTTITEAIIARQEGNKLLIEARDRLLPKLMSGELEA